MPQDSYAYALSALLALPIWIGLFFVRKETRTEMLLASLVVGILAPLWEPWFLHVYWTPPGTMWQIALGDFIYGFVAGGIGAVVYEFLFKTRHAKRRARIQRLPLLTFSLGVAALLLFHVPTLFGLSPLYAALLCFLPFIGVMAVTRPDLWTDMFVSGLVFGIGTFAIFFIFSLVFPEALRTWWNYENLSGHTLWKVPLEELLWAGTLGMTIGPAYEFFAGIHFKKQVARH